MSDNSDDVPLVTGVEPLKKYRVEVALMKYMQNYPFLSLSVSRGQLFGYLTQARLRITKYSELLGQWGSFNMKPRNSPRCLHVDRLLVCSAQTTHKLGIEPVGPANVHCRL